MITDEGLKKLQSQPTTKLSDLKRLVESKGFVVIDDMVILPVPYYPSTMWNPFDINYSPEFI